MGYWLQSYLEGRGQLVELNATKSSILQVKYGVPHGSLLGPRLFSIYVNNFPDCVSEGEVHLYADDATAYAIGDSVDEITLKLNHKLDEICTWCARNRLTIHTEKTEAMILQRQKFVGPLLLLRRGERFLEYTNKVKMLGVFIDSRLTWNNHIEHPTKQLSSNLQALKRMRFLPTRLLEQIYF